MESDYSARRSPGTALAVILSVSAAVVFVGWLAWNLLQPSFEKVFWQTVEDNLSSRSLSVSTTIEVDSPTGSLEILNNQLQLSFAPEASAGWQQTSLLYDKALAQHYLNPGQIERLEELDQIPDQELYRQTAFSLGSSVYFQHQIETRPLIEDWTDQYATTLEGGASLDGSWYRRQLLVHPIDSLQRFLMNALSTHGFLYGYLDYEARQPLLEQLRQVYIVDFDDGQSFWLAGRLYYQYELRLNYAEFGQVLVDYFNAHIASEEQRVELTEEEVRSLLRPQPAAYTVTVDVWARRITEVSYPFSIPFVSPYRVLSEDNWELAPQFSSLIGDLRGAVDWRWQTKVRFFNQNQVLEFEPPAATDLKDSQ